jgi:hypothetical protein
MATPKDCGDARCFQRLMRVKEPRGWRGRLGRPPRVVGGQARHSGQPRAAGNQARQAPVLLSHSRPAKARPPHAGLDLFGLLGMCSSVGYGPGGRGLFEGPNVTRSTTSRRGAMPRVLAPVPDASPLRIRFLNRGSQVRFLPRAHGAAAASCSGRIGGWT